VDFPQPSVPSKVINKLIRGKLTKQGGEVKPSCDENKKATHSKVDGFLSSDEERRFF